MTLECSVIRVVILFSFSPVMYPEHHRNIPHCALTHRHTYTGTHGHTHLHIEEATETEFEVHTHTHTHTYTHPHPHTECNSTTSNVHFPCITNSPQDKLLLAHFGCPPDFSGNMMRHPALDTNILWYRQCGPKSCDYPPYSATRSMI